LTDLSVDAVMSELQARVRERLQRQLAEQGAHDAYQHPQIFAEVERLLGAGAQAGERTPLILPELLGDPETWRLRVGMRYETHRQGALGAAIVFAKRRLLMPALRWLFEYSRDNFERQRRVNQVLFACVQELALETARLRQELQQRTRE
jgi:hypothetical protein